MKQVRHSKLTLEKIDAYINYWQNVKKYWLTDFFNGKYDFNTILHGLYIKNGNVSGVIQDLTDAGILKQGKKVDKVKYTPTDITTIIKTETIQDEVLKQICLSIYNDNFELSVKISG